MSPLAIWSSQLQVEGSDLKSQYCIAQITLFQRISCTSAKSPGMGIGVIVGPGPRRGHVRYIQDDQ